AKRFRGRVCGFSAKLAADPCRGPGAIFGLVRGKWPGKPVARHPDAARPKIAEGFEDCEGCTSRSGCNLRGRNLPGRSGSRGAGRETGRWGKGGKWGQG